MCTSTFILFMMTSNKAGKPLLLNGGFFFAQLMFLSFCLWNCLDQDSYLMLSLFSVPFSLGSWNIGRAIF
jgi:hypothetical protein